MFPYYLANVVLVALLTYALFLKKLSLIFLPKQIAYLFLLNNIYALIVFVVQDKLYLGNLPFLQNFYIL